MSNRKFRTNRTEYLYMIARGVRAPGRGYEGMMTELLKDGLVERYRYEVSGPRKRNNGYRLTDKAWALLAKRSRSLNSRIRVHRSVEGMVPWRYLGKYENKSSLPLHEEAEAYVNFPEPGDNRPDIQCWKTSTRTMRRRYGKRSKTFSS